MNHQNIKSGANRLLKKKFQQFGSDYVAAYSGLNQLSGIPDDIRQQMTAQQLFGVGISTEFNGCGGSAQSLAIAGKTLVEYGGNIGLAVSWLIHEITARWLILFWGTDRQKKTYLPRLAAGKKTASFAVSEPGVGAHPKHIKTSAEKVSDGYLLNGEKTYLTNGPMADFFIVIAVTGKIAGKNRFTAFIIPKDSPGLEVTDPLILPFLHPCPHGGIRLNNCRVTPEQMLGAPGSAYPDMVLPFRTIEDTLLMGLMIGGMEFLLRHLIFILNQNPMAPDDSLIRDLARTKYSIDGLTVICEAAAEKLDNNNDNELLLSARLFFRAQIGEILKTIERIIDTADIKPDHKITHMINDLSALMRIAESGLKLKLEKLGLFLLTGDQFLRD